MDIEVCTLFVIIRYYSLLVEKPKVYTNNIHLIQKSDE